MTTALSVYATNTNATTISTARLLVMSTGAGTTNTFSSLCGTATGYGEIFSQGTTGAWAAAGSIGAPSNHGWLLDVTTLEGQQILAGNWTMRFRGKVSVGTVTADLYIRAYVYNGGVYTQIGSNLLFSGQTLTTTSTNFDFSAASLPVQNFGMGDKLYLDCPVNIISNSTGSSAATISVVEAVSSTQGNLGSFKGDTPGYQVIPRTIPSTAAVQATITRTALADAALLLTQTRTLSPATAALQLTKTRTMSATAALQSTRTRTISATVVLQFSSGTRGISTSAALLLTQSRTMSTSSALLSTATRTMNVTAALLAQRIVPATGAFFLADQTRAIPASASFALYIAKFPTASRRTGRFPTIHRRGASWP